ncbi:TonB-dependent siderophore receptor [Bacteroides sp. 224]|uniref:TonB-dependent receptor plug domain-containing protein n=1 Tax=Bacteroides sp. 224 TaxID=2302936 RepID=UPI0013D5D934|nr:TonB-dependent receptor [Bacteroides sp. 224]NDV64509.1 TonB-dependent receptor [Bacteroides sp. 224]
MKENKLTKQRVFRWKQFNRKAYSAFVSLSFRKEFCIGVLTTATLGFANVDTLSAQNTTKAQIENYELEEVEVTGTRVPLTEAQSAKMVTVLTRNDIQAAAVHSINDLLEYVTGVDVRQRGEFGIQTDISVRGGTFDQVTILLNGVNFTNPQTGHNTADFPVSMQDIERIEVLEGPAARVFGTSAFTGAINIVTRNDRQSHVSANVMGGSYGLLGTGARVNYTKGALSNQLSGGYHRADGDQKNSDFAVKRTYYQGTYTSREVDIRWQLGMSDTKYGANTYYSAKYNNQYEELRRYSASVQAETKGKLRFAPTLYWNRMHDHYQLIRGISGSKNGENFHLNDIYGVNLNAYFNSVIGKTAFGAEFRNEGILSTNSGKRLHEDEYVKVPGEEGIYFTQKDNRTNIGYYLEHNILLRDLTISMGVMANMNTGLDHKYRLYPGIDVSYRPAPQWKIYASWNKALRMPTFFDLYYTSAVIEGNNNLKPEETQAFNLGAKYRNELIDASISGFYHKGKNMIDWVKYTENDELFHSANFKLDNMGVETSLVMNPRRKWGENCFINTLSVAYTYIYQERHDKTEIYKSNYALEYLRHKFVARLEHHIWNKLHASWGFRWQKRMGSYQEYINLTATEKLIPYPSYCLLDVKLFWNHPKYAVFAEANNVLNRAYYDIGNIPQPGIWIKGGISYRINFR